MVLYNAKQFVTDEVKPALLNDFTEELKKKPVSLENTWVGHYTKSEHVSQNGPHTLFGKVQLSSYMKNKQKT